jgi:hypothetical protein
MQEIEQLFGIYLSVTDPNYKIKDNFKSRMDLMCLV